MNETVGVSGRSPEKKQKEEVGLWTLANGMGTLTQSSSRKISASGWSGSGELAGVSWEEFAERLSAEGERVMEWRNGSAPSGGEV